MTLLKVVFWTSAGLLAYTHVGYPLALAALGRVLGSDEPESPPDDAPLPSVSVIVAAYAEAAVIADRVANLRALHYPQDRLEVIVASDGSPDDTAVRAREAGADIVLELPRVGKVRAQDAGVDRARGDLVAFSDANVKWAPDALRELVEAVRRARRRLCLRKRALCQRARHQPGGRVLAL